MEFLKSVHPFVWGLIVGLLLGLFLWALSAIAHMKTKKELKRLKGHLSDKLEIEAEKMTEMKQDIDELKGENENLRMKVNSGKIQDSAQSLEKELEIFARAEKSMTLNAPGFAQAWENAKEGAHTELVEEERGKSLPKRIFRKFFNKGESTEMEAETKMISSNDEEEDDSSRSSD